MNKISISNWYLVYLLLMGKLFMLLNNGESGKLTGIYLLVIITGIFFLICVDDIKMEGNKYITSFIAGFTMFFIKYSSYRDLNKRFNIAVITYLILLLAVQMAILIFQEIKRRKWKSIFFMILIFFQSVKFVNFMTIFYWEPRNIVYSSYFSKIKDKEEMKRIIKKLPMIDSVSITEFKKPKQYDDDFDVREFSGEIDQVIDISVKYSVNGEGLNSLVKQVKNYLKLVGDEKKTTRIYITDRYAYYKPIRVYEIKNGVTKIRYIRKNAQYNDSSFSDIFLELVKISKGKSDNSTEGEYYD
ncbi:hypothetical protein JCM16775_1784 [Leptotrichia hofstadii]|uniref:Uncharacterized protein n=2 Tax=Leptotrichia hofstadii TaxID=157688 RepID=A0A510JMV1_9FUSO|nr:hypothetical protein [Leptotrichia hofstadii]BBM39073.1 hypothetical protein JCM16775_1784 [Leptotrichia hofstadii]